MLINGSRLQGCPILSLHVGGKIAQVVRSVIDPDSLKIIAFEIESPLSREGVGDFLPTESIREFSRLGMIVDSADEFVDGESVVRIRQVLELDFNLINLKVVTKSGNKLGKVSGFTVEPESWQIQQLIVQRPLIKSFLDPELTISRLQIVSVDDYRVVIKDETSKRKASSVVSPQLTTTFINPFREPDFAPEIRQKSPDQK